jgi:hypothetical protein
MGSEEDNGVGSGICCEERGKKVIIPLHPGLLLLVDSI